ncbi:uncharacterized protein LAESUDRAFT_676817 [Laetiporus sulphureus 93-53]|uniref:DUF1308 domain-containing protein n=1 Tax=Laetiporus sulphureus 93-53 TaxID=1314785 RepID=A0A165F1F0_9APHY|nr:uncharacterized protein LAESUDRAFT_676817 [Laetiporus sulphureus 93-53]KZT08168.1 hypothetical protein LAESUDRAFT_676817 [Laetiporus sulphureus 93-53]
MDTGLDDAVHPELQSLRSQLRGILQDMANFGPTVSKPPILDTSFDHGRPEGEKENANAAPHESVSGLRALRDAVRRDLDVLEKFLDDPRCASLPPLSTNAPYLIAVWNEVLLATPPVVAIWRTYYDSQHVRSASKRRSQKPPGVKVDVVVDNGRRWVRVYTTKNSRMLAEFGEIDSYMTDSEDGSDEESGDHGSSLASASFDNSILKAGRALIKAAQENPLPGTNEPPAVTMRLTRLEPSPSDPKDHDPRIAETIDELKKMGIDVQLGEREVSSVSRPTTHPPKHIPRYEPTLHINLDLSILIALVSDITHAPLPKSPEEAEARFVPPPQYREWKKKRIEMTEGVDAAAYLEGWKADEGLGVHSRALSNQALQEMAKGLIQDIHDHLRALAGPSSTPGFPPVEFWTTPDAWDRFLRIVLSRIGGTNEKRRAQALFHPVADPAMTREEAEESYWRDSRYPRGFLPLLPIKIFPASEPEPGLQPPSHAYGEGGQAERQPLSPFFRQLAGTCRRILAQETTSPSGTSTPSLEEPSHSTPKSARDIGEMNVDMIPRAAVTKVNPRLTVHTMQSMLWGTVRGWTTLTANKASVKAILKEIKAAREAGTERYDYEFQETGGEAGDEVEKAVLWVVDPRSLAEGMRSDLNGSSSSS